MIKRKLLSVLTLSILISTSIFAQQAQIHPEKIIAATSVKNQCNTGTCWAFATVSLIESELLRTGKGDYDLSEMFFIYQAYIKKAVLYVRLQGHHNFGGGGQAHDIINLFGEFGAVPEEVYSGLLNGNTYHDHTSLDSTLSAYLNIVIKPEDGVLKENWIVKVRESLDKYLGQVPEKFKWENKNWTPKSFAEGLGINASDYVEITSYTHHPFYQRFCLEVPDNWSFDYYYNLPIDELVAVVDNALESGYTVAWDGDVSDETGFTSNGGVANLPDEKKTVTQKMRQDAFDNYTVTDDHLMLLTGYGKDEDGNRYYLTKNSWGESRGKGGYWYMSGPWVRLKTIAIMVNKNGIPAETRKKLGIE